MGVPTPFQMPVILTLSSSRSRKICFKAIQSKSLGSYKKRNVGDLLPQNIYDKTEESRRGWQLIIELDQGNGTIKVD